MKSILDPTFKYTNSVETDIRKTFARIRREAKAEAEKKPAERNTKIALLFGDRKPKE